MRTFSHIKKIASVLLAVLMLSASIPLASFGDPTDIDVSGGVAEDVSLEENTEGTTATVTGDVSGDISVEENVEASDVGASEDTEELDEQNSAEELGEQSEDTSGEEGTNGASGDEEESSESAGNNEEGDGSSDVPSEFNGSDEGDTSELAEDSDPEVPGNDSKDENTDADDESGNFDALADADGEDVYDKESEDTDPSLFLSESKFSTNSLNGSPSLSLDSEEFGSLGNGGVSLMSTGNRGATIATLKTGKQFNEAIKKLVNSSAFFGTEDTTITEIKFVDTPFTSETELQSSGEKVYARLSETAVEIYTAADIVYSNADMQNMFYEFNKLTSLDLSRFNTSNATNMNAIFYGCKSLALLNLSNFDTSNVANMSYMFSNCSSLTSLDVSSFNTSNVTNMDSMFCNCTLLTSLNLSNFDTSNVTNMSYMFSNCQKLSSLNISNFDFSAISSLIKIKNFFYRIGIKHLYIKYNSAYQISIPLDMFIDNDSDGISDYMTSSKSFQYSAESQTSVYHYVKKDYTATYICDDVTKYLPVLSGKKISTIWWTPTKEGYEFAGWCTDEARTTLFNYDTAITSNITLYGKWKLPTFTVTFESNGGTMSSYSSEVEQGSLLTKPANPTKDGNIFNGWFKDEELTEEWNFNNDTVTENITLYAKWIESDGRAHIDSTFKTKLKTASSSKYASVKYVVWVDTAFTGTQLQSSDSAYPIYGRLKSDNVTVELYTEADEVYLPSDCTEIFSLTDFTSLQSFDLSKFNTSEVTVMKKMFYSNKKLTSLDLSGFDTSNVTDMESMFDRCEALTSLDLSSFDTRNVTTLRSLFYNDSKLTSINLSSFDTSKVESLRYAFYNCSSLTSLNLSNFNTSKVTTMYHTFENCSSLTELDLSGFSMAKGPDVPDLLKGCTGLTKIKLCKNEGQTAITLPNSFYIDDDGNKIPDSNTSTNSVAKGTTAHTYIKTISCTVTFDSQGGSAVSSVAGWSGALISAPENPTKSGTEFVGWHKESTCKNEWDFGEDVVTGDVTLYAKWNVVESYDLLSGPIPEKLSSQGYSFGSGYYTDYSDVTVGGKSVYSYSKIKNIVFTEEPFTSTHELQASDSPEKIYARVSDDLETIEIYTPADKIRVIDGDYLFAGCCNITSLDLSKFESTEPISMMFAFSHCEKLETLDLGNILIVNAKRMFHLCKKLGTINNLNVINPTNIEYMFYYCESLTSLDVSRFNTSNVTDMRGVFQYCGKLTTITGLSNFDTSNVTSMLNMFSNCLSLESLDLSNFDTGNVTNMGNMFSYCRKLTSLDLSNFDTTKVTNMMSMFCNCLSLVSLNISNFNTSNVADMGSMFSGCEKLTSLDVSNFDTSNVSNMLQMFLKCKKLTSLDVSNFNTSNVTKMNYMFYECNSLTSLDLSSFDTNNVINMSYMFGNCLSLASLDLSGFDTSKVTDMRYMFYYCNSLESLDVSNFNTSNVISMIDMFYGCRTLAILDLSSFNTSNVTNMASMFKNCSSLVSLDLSSFNTSKVTDMSYAFSGCSSLAFLNLSSFDTSKVTTMEEMFSNCSSLESLDVLSFRTPALTKAFAMFNGCMSLTELDLSNFDFANIIISNSSTYNIGGLVTTCRNLKKIKSPQNVHARVSLDNKNADLSQNVYWYLDDNEDLVADSKRTYSAMIEDTPSHTYIRNDIEGFELPTYVSVLKPGTDVNTVLSGLDITNITWKTEAWDNVEESANIARDGDLSVYVRRVEKQGGVTPVSGVAAKIAKTSNVSDTGVKNGNYDNSANVNTTVSFPGAGLLHVTLTYGTESNYDFVYVFSGEYTGTTNLKNKSPMPDGFVQKYCGSQTTVEFDVEGDAVTFTFQSDGSVSSYYGYFASVVPAEREPAGYVGELYTEADVVRFNEDCSGMFEGLPLKRIGMFAGHSTLTVDTSTAKNVSSMFKNCSDLKALDLSGFVMDGESIVTDLLTGCEKLEEVKLCANNSGSAVVFPKAFVVDDDSNGKADSPATYESVSSGTVSHRYIEVPPYIVTFETGEGSVVLPAKVAPGHLLTKPADPTRAHFNFVNWYTSEDCLDGEEWDFENSAVNSDMTLYAKWEQTEFCVTLYNPVGAPFGTRYFAKNSVITGIDDAPDFGEMYDFVCWSKTRGENDPWDFSTPVTSDMALYAYANFTGTHVFFVEDWSGVFTSGAHYLGDVPRTSSGLDAINEYSPGNHTYTAEELKADERDAVDNLANLEGFWYGFIGEELSDISWQGVIDVEAPLNFEEDSVIIAPAYDKVFVNGSFFRGVLSIIDESLKTGSSVSEMTKRQQIEYAYTYTTNLFNISGMEDFANLYRSLLSSRIKSVTYSDTKPENAIKLTVGEKISDFCWFGVDEEGNVSVYSERPLIAKDLSRFFIGLVNAEDLSLIEHVESLDLDGQSYLTAGKMSTMYALCNSIKTIDLSGITLKDASGSSGNSLDIGCAQEGALSEKYIMTYVQYSLESDNIARSFLSKADIARAIYDVAILGIDDVEIPSNMSYEDWLDTTVSERGLSLSENASISDKEEAVGNVFYEQAVQELKAGIGAETFELYQSLGIPDSKLSEIFMPQAAEDSQISMRLSCVSSTERSEQGYCGLWAEDLDCNYVADDGGNVNGDFYPGKHYIKCMPYAYGEYVVENEGTDDAEITFCAHEEGLYYADGEHTVPEISSDVLAEWTHDAGVPGLSGWSRFANVKTRYDFSQPADYAVVLFPIWGNEDYTLTVPDEITWNAGYFDIEFNCDEDYIGSVTLTITSGSLDFSERGYTVSLCDDYDKTREFTGVTFTEAGTKRVYLKKTSVGTEKAGTTTKFITFDIAS